MKIIVPTDFSANADHALKYASLLSKTINAKLILLHVYTPPITKGSITYPLIGEDIHVMVREATEKLQIISGALSEEYGIGCQLRVRVGIPVEEIVLEVEATRAELIVMGTRGASGLGKVLFGSNTASVMEKAISPVLIVPTDSPLTLPKKIVFATNYEDNDLRTVSDLIKLTRQLKAEYILLHVSKDDLKSEQDLIEHFSKAVSKEVNIEQPFYYVMRHDDVQKGIDQFADSVGVDLVALSMRQRSVFKRLFGSSLSKEMAYKARLPLLIFHGSN